MKKLFTALSVCLCFLAAAAPQALAFPAPLWWEEIGCGGTKFQWDINLDGYEDYEHSVFLNFQCGNGTSETWWSDSNFDFVTDWDAATYATPDNGYLNQAQIAENKDKDKFTEQRTSYFYPKSSIYKSADDSQWKMKVTELDSNNNGIPNTTTTEQGATYTINEITWPDPVQSTQGTSTYIKTAEDSPSKEDGNPEKITEQYITEDAGNVTKVTKDENSNGKPESITTYYDFEQDGFDESVEIKIFFADGKSLKTVEKKYDLDDDKNYDSTTTYFFSEGSDNPYKKRIETEDPKQIVEEQKAGEGSEFGTRITWSNYKGTLPAGAPNSSYAHFNNKKTEYDLKVGPADDGYWQLGIKSLKTTKESQDGKRDIESFSNDVAAITGMWEKKTGEEGLKLSFVSYGHWALTGDPAKRIDWSATDMTKSVEAFQKEQNDYPTGQGSYWHSTTKVENLKFVVKSGGGWFIETTAAMEVIKEGAGGRRIVYNPFGENKSTTWVFGLKGNKASTEEGQPTYSLGGPFSYRVVEDGTTASDGTWDEEIGEGGQPLIDRSGLYRRIMEWPDDNKDYKDGIKRGKRTIQKGLNKNVWGISESGKDAMLIWDHQTTDTGLKKLEGPNSGELTLAFMPKRSVKEFTTEEDDKTALTNYNGIKFGQHGKCLTPFIKELCDGVGATNSITQSCNCNCNCDESEESWWDSLPDMNPLGLLLFFTSIPSHEEINKDYEPMKQQQVFTRITTNYNDQGQVYYVKTEPGLKAEISDQFSFFDPADKQQKDAYGLIGKPELVHERWDQNLSGYFERARLFNDSLNNKPGFKSIDLFDPDENSTAEVEAVEEGGPPFNATNRTINYYEPKDGVRYALEKEIDFNSDGKTESSTATYDLDNSGKDEIKATKTYGPGLNNLAKLGLLYNKDEKGDLENGWEVKSTQYNSDSDPNLEEALTTYKQKGAQVTVLTIDDNDDGQPDEGKTEVVDGGNKDVTDDVGKKPADLPAPTTEPVKGGPAEASPEPQQSPIDTPPADKGVPMPPAGSPPQGSGSELPAGAKKGPKEKQNSKLPPDWKVIDGGGNGDISKWPGGGSQGPCSEDEIWQKDCKTVEAADPRAYGEDVGLPASLSWQNNKVTLGRIKLPPSSFFKICMYAKDINAEILNNINDIEKDNEYPKTFVKQPKPPQDDDSILCLTDAVQAYKGNDPYHRDREITAVYMGLETHTQKLATVTRIFSVADKSDGVVHIDSESNEYSGMYMTQYTSNGKPVTEWATFRESSLFPTFRLRKWKIKGDSTVLRNEYIYKTRNNGDAKYRTEKTFDGEGLIKTEHRHIYDEKGELKLVMDQLYEPPLPVPKVEDNWTRNGNIYHRTHIELTPGVGSNFQTRHEIYDKEGNLLMVFPSDAANDDEEGGPNGGGAGPGGGGGSPGPKGLYCSGSDYNPLCSLGGIFDPRVMMVMNMNGPKIQTVKGPCTEETPWYCEKGDWFIWTHPISTKNKKYQYIVDLVENKEGGGVFNNAHFMGNDGAGNNLRLSLKYTSEEYAIEMGVPQQVKIHDAKLISGITGDYLYNYKRQMDTTTSSIAFGIWFRNPYVPLINKVSAEDMIDFAPGTYRRTYFNRLFYKKVASLVKDKKIQVYYNDQEEPTEIIIENYDGGGKVVNKLTIDCNKDKNLCDQKLDELDNTNVWN